MKRLLLAMLICSFGAMGCASYGTGVTVGIAPSMYDRAIDQEIMSEVIDEAFKGLKIPSLSTGSAFIEVYAPSALNPAVADYLRGKTMMAIANTGLAVRDVEQKENDNGKIVTTKPETDVKVVALVAYAGIDTVASDPSRSHPRKKGTTLNARVKLTVNVISGKAKVAPFSQTISAEKSLKIDREKYHWPATE